MGCYMRMDFKGRPSLKSTTWYKGYAICKEIQQMRRRSLQHLRGKIEKRKRVAKRSPNWIKNSQVQSQKRVAQRKENRTKGSMQLLTWVIITRREKSFWNGDSYSWQFVPLKSKPKHLTPKMIEKFRNKKWHFSHTNIAIIWTEICQSLIK